MPFKKILNRGHKYLTLLPQADFNFNAPGERGEGWILRFVFQGFYT
jgi:hypothetical protein